MSSRFFVFDGPAHGRQVEFHGGALEMKGTDGRWQRYEMLVHRREGAEFQVLAPPHTRNQAGLEEFIDEYRVAPAAVLC
jgi:hypothetical protein